MADGVKVKWAYRPDDRSKQGKTETLPRDLAALKVSEGLAVYVEDKPKDTDESQVPVVTDAASGKSTKRS